MPHELTARWYAGLPEAFRGLDVDDQLLGWLDALGQEVGDVTDLIARFDRRYPGDRGYDPDVDADSTSDLIDPLTADSGWLAWVGQLYGARVERAEAPISFAGTYGQLGLDFASYTALAAAFASYSAMEDAVTPPVFGLTDVELRTYIAQRLGWRAGSAGAIRAAVQPWLIGAKSVVFRRHQGNQLTADEASLESSVAAWVNDTNVVNIARVVGTGADGGAFLRVTAGVTQAGVEALGVRLPTGAAGKPIVAGRPITAVAAFRAVATPRNCRVRIDTYSAAGAYQGTTRGATVLNTTTGWTFAVAQMTPGAGDAFATIVLEWTATAAGELQDVDAIMLRPGADTVWTPGGAWTRVEVHTLAAETPNAWQIPIVLAREGVAPAGVQLVHVVDP